ncbi:MAG: hypothetical protein IMZ55_02585 [Acidobacteria bacterium]|nr:hypothetical protein [Planctomycetota bacterium]MBE3132333.1 hypothetical protein [Acidobacteriota bacterium]
MSASAARGIAVVVVGLAALAFLAAGAAAYTGGGGGMNQWDSEDTEAVAKKRQERLAKDAKEFGKALAAVEREESEALEALDKAKTDAAEQAKGDDVREKRLITMARTKAIAKLDQVAAKYARVVAAVRKFEAEPNLPEVATSEIGIVTARLKGCVRANRERVGDLYEELGKSRKALAIYESVYNTIPEKQRMNEQGLKAKIDALKDKLGIKRDEAKSAAGA